MVPGMGGRGVTDMERLESLMDKAIEYERRAHDISFYLDRCQGSWKELKDKSVLSKDVRELMANGLEKIFDNMGEAEALAENIGEQLWHLARKERER